MSKKKKEQLLNFPEWKESRKKTTENRMMPGLGLIQQRLGKGKNELRMKEDYVLNPLPLKAVNSMCWFVLMWLKNSIIPSDSVKQHVVLVTSWKSAADARWHSENRHSLNHLSNNKYKSIVRLNSAKWITERGSWEVSRKNMSGLAKQVNLKGKQPCKR